MKKEKTEKLKKLEIEEIDKQINLENSEFINNKNLIMYFDILMLGAFLQKIGKNIPMNQILMSYLKKLILNKEMKIHLLLLNAH